MKKNVSPKKQKKTISVQTFFIVYSIVFVFFFLLLGEFLLQWATDVGEERAYERLNWEAQQVNAHIEQVLNTTRHINTANAEMIGAGVLDNRSQTALQQYFLVNLREFDFFSSVYFGNASGGLADASRQARTDDYYLIGTDNFTAGTFRKILLDEQNQPLETVAEIPDFDARQRDWYRNALAADKNIWSEPYLLFTGQDMAIANSVPVYDAQDHFLGVATIEIFLDDFSKLLADDSRQSDKPNGQSFIIEPNGLLIAASQYPVLATASGAEEYTRQSLRDIEAPQVQALVDFLDKSNIDLATIAAPLHFRVKTEQGDYLVSIQSISGDQQLDWLTVVVYPEAVFLGAIAQQGRAAIAVFLVVGLVVFLLSIYFSNLLLRPNLRLIHSMRSLDFDNPVVDPPMTHFTELNQLSTAFAEVSNRLHHALRDLREEVAEHQQSKEQLLLSEARYRSTVEDAPGFLCRFTPAYEITFANKCYAEYFNMTTAEILGLNFMQFVYEPDREKVMRELHLLNSEKPVGSLTQRTYLPNGEIHHQRWINHAIFSQNGEVIGYQAFGEDIQEEYKTRQAHNALYRIWQAANRVSTLNELYPAIHTIIQEVVSFKNLIIALYDEERELLIPSYFVDEQDAAPDATVSMQGPSAYVLETQASLLCTAQEFLALKPETNPDAIYGSMPKIWLGVPLTLGEKVIGIIATQDYEDETALGAYEKEFLEQLSPAIAATIARHRAVAEIQAYAQTNALLFRASQVINEALHAQSLYRALYRFISEVMDCDTFIISDYAPEAKTITCAFLVQDDIEQDGSTFPVLPLNSKGEGTQSRAILSKKARLVNDYLAELRTSQNSYQIDDDGKLHRVDPHTITNEKVARSALIVPLILRGEVSGVIQVMSYQQNAYTLADLRLLEALSSQIGIVRTNIGLYEQAQAEIEMRKAAEENLRTLNAQLEESIHARTKELFDRIATVEKLNTGMANILHDLNIAKKKAELTAFELRESNTELESFTYSVSHDLRAPLRHIQSFAKRIYDDVGDHLDEKDQRYFQNLFKASDKMENLIQDMLELSRAGRVDFHLKRLDMNAIVGSVREELFDEVEGRDIRWKIATLPNAEGDPGLIKIVWTNLIGNAVKYTRPRQVAVIEIGSLPIDHPGAIADQQVFFIRDNGVGFDDTYIDNLFGVFQRLHQDDEFEGNGIGLATVRRIVLRHGGRVWAESALEGGATFYFSLPIRVQSES